VVASGYLWGGPAERVLWLSVASSLFPQLPRNSRTAFRVGLVALLAALLLFAQLRWQAPLIGVAALGVPVLFVIYLDQTGAFDGTAIRMSVLTSVSAIAIGVGWALPTNEVLARSRGAAMGRAMTGDSVLLVALVIPRAVLP
jgi:hypothetical protein